ncbi:Branched-chain amino acid transport ATP-binding protein livG [Granulibacter bethesdensis]|nr:Branched-chain amino acid transport ATP-binding protein livG [Granulibacter bethesdensis]
MVCRCCPDRSGRRYTGAEAAMSTREQNHPILSLEGIGLSFGRAVVLSDLSFTVGRQEIRAIIGPNGAGKSSLINIISGLYQPDHGTIRYDGVPYRRMRPERLAAQGVARTFQNLALFGALSVRENVLLGLRGVTRPDVKPASVVAEFFNLPHARRIRDRALEETDITLRQLGLWEIADRPAASLPYGLRKRVELARALVARPRLLLLDEPFAGMEAQDRHELAALIRSVHQERGGAILLIEHDIGLVLSLADRAVVLDYGRLIADGTPAEIRADPAVLAAYLGQRSHEAIQQERAI